MFKDATPESPVEKINDSGYLQILEDSSLPTVLFTDEYDIDISRIEKSDDAQRLLIILTTHVDHDISQRALNICRKVGQEQLIEALEYGREILLDKSKDPQRRENIVDAITIELTENVPYDLSRNSKLLGSIMETLSEGIKSNDTKLQQWAKRMIEYIEENIFKDPQELNKLSPTANSQMKEMILRTKHI
jgi:hypothetical protein